MAVDLSRMFHVQWLGYFGLLFVCILTLKLLSFFLRFATKLLGGLGFSTNVKGLGKWAVVTGCTDGIGKSYAEQLAKKGCSIVLISRSPTKLTALAKDLEASFAVETKCIVADFTHVDIYENIKNDLVGLDVGVLVNNVGISYEYPEYFLEIPQKKIEDFFNVNMMSMTKMCSIVLPGMVVKGKGAIVNVSSFAANFPVPLLSLYSATKVYVDYLSRGLHEEYRSKGITVQSVLPYFVTTKLSKIRHPSLLIPSPTTYVKSALNLLGLETTGEGYWPHMIVVSLVMSVPRWIINRYTMLTHLSLRAKALKKRGSKCE